MLFRLMSASLIVGTIVIMSPTRQAPSSPKLSDGADAGPRLDGIAAMLREDAPTLLRAPDGVTGALAGAMVRGVVADGSERLRRELGATPDHKAEPAAAADTLQPDDRRPAWRAGAHR